MSDGDFYFADNPTDYVVGPMGGPMYRSWDYDPKNRPSSEALARYTEILKSRWSEIVGADIALSTRPLGFTGNKARRLLVHASGTFCPPWGGWSYLSRVESERRSFTQFRASINKTIQPHEVDHVDFITDND